MTNSQLSTIQLFCFLQCLFFWYSSVGQIIPIGKVITKNKISQIEKLKKLSPGGNMFKPAERVKTWKSIEQNKSLQISNRNNDSWKLVGPQGIISSQGINFVCSGRIRDVEILDDNHLRVASASGGLWDVQKGADGKVKYHNLSSTHVASSWSGTVASDPSNPNIILLGTGEPAIRGGSGLWKTYDNGITWENILMDGGIGNAAFDEMEYTDITGKVWTCGSEGVFFSKNGGTTWEKKKNGNHPGMVIYAKSPDTILVSEYDRGIYRTYNGGRTWQLLINGLPTENFSRIELSNCKSQPDVIYALYTNKAGHTLGIYKTINGGNSWDRCLVIDDNGVKDVDYHWGMAWYNSFISVSPINPNHVISGGGWYVYSNDGQNFYGPVEGQHPDFHAGGWSKDGQKVWYANDGGIYATSFDQKWKWNLEFNHLPITQFVSLAVSHTNPKVMIGGTQDNGFVYYNDKVKRWFYFLGDGGGVAIDPNDDEKMYGTLGVAGPPLTFNNYRKHGPSAAGWQDINVGLKSSAQWWRLVRTDQNNPATLFTQTDNKLYYSYNEGSTWDQLSFQDLELSSINSMKVSHGEFPKIYVCGDGPIDEQIMVLDFAIWEWTNITKGLPVQNDQTGFSTPSVFTSDNPLFENRVYAVIRGYGPQLNGKNIFKSDNAGLDWTNISGNLPNVPFLVVFEHPKNDNILVAGTDGFGIYLSENGGRNWSLWDTGMPKGAMITDIDYQNFNDSIFVVVSTYGHSIMRRFIPSSGPVHTKDIEKTPFVNHIKKAYYDGNNIHLELSGKTSDNALFKICNIDGKCIYQEDIRNEENNFTADINGLPSGVYVCSLSNQLKLVGTAKIVVP